MNGADTRYARQQVLPEVGAQGQAALARAHVLVVGAGGLGCPALPLLAGAGVGHVTLVDPDVVSESNLHRQTLYREDQIGRPKAEAAARALRALNSACRVRAVMQALTPANVATLAEGAAVVLDCADSFAASYILSDHCLDARVPLISASALGFEGYAGGFCGGAPSLRAVFPDLPERAATCATAGVLGPVVGTLGAIQAQMALSVLLELSPDPLGQMVTLDLRSYRFGGFRFDGAPEPEGPPLRFIAPQDIGPEDFTAELRDHAEAPVPAAPHAHRLSVADFGPHGPRPAPGQRAVLCCRSGLRSWQAARRLQAVWNGPITLVAMGDTPESSERLP